MMDRPRNWLAAFSLALTLLCAAIQAHAADVKPCEPAKVATRYPGLAGKTITIGQDGNSLPFSYRDPKDPDHLIGADTDYARAVFACIGMPVKFSIAQWGGLLPAVTSGRIDAMWDTLYYTPERAKVVDFVLYSTAADAALVHKGNPKHLASLDGLCGTRALGGLGTIEIALLHDLSAKCTAAGKPAIDAITYTDRPSAWQMIETDRADVMLGSAVIVKAITAEKPDLLQSAFTFLPDIKVGVAVAKGRTELEHALEDTIAATQADGEMARIYQHYGLDPGLILAPKILTK
jgi:polar amino acid transport system substrate-binding protein